MTTARVVGERPEVVFGEDGRRVLARDLVVDLGVRMYDLEDWALDLKLVDPWVTPSRISCIDVSTCILIPAGFDYDGASIPGIAQDTIMGPKEGYEVAGCVHDALYRWQCNRALCDRIFRLIARSGSKAVTPARAWLGWAALRMFGGHAYRAYRS